MIGGIILLGFILLFVWYRAKKAPRGVFMSQEWIDKHK